MTHDAEPKRGLPEFPAPFYHAYKFASPFGGEVWRMSYTYNGQRPLNSMKMFTADQMRAYALAAIEKDRAERSDAVPTLQDHIQGLVAAHGSLNKVAKATGINIGYLSRLSRQVYLNPSINTLRRLGLKTEYSVRPLEEIIKEDKP